MTTLSTAEPLTFPEDSLYEVVDGQVVEKEMSGFAILIALKLYSSWLKHIIFEGRGSGTPLHEMVFVIDAKHDLRRRPDVSFVSAERWPVNRGLPLEGDWAVIPDIAVEVLSPHDLYQQVDRKLREYLSYGVREVWLVSPEARKVEICSSLNSRASFEVGDTLKTPLIPGWTMEVADLIPLPAPPAGAADRG